ncbi:hypothetical protein [Parapedobacter sp. 2B3]|uniref:hypothetical protein n=1 Tax=Parapedobacter sp. 2B3 TaxID=3342381 RepID=UPI0035B5D610
MNQLKRNGMVYVCTIMVCLTLSCGKRDNISSESQLANMTSQLCPNVRGVRALYWDLNNGVLRGDIPGGVPTIKNPGGYYINSGYPALGFQMPQGYQAFELSGNSTIGVNVLRNDNNVLWRYVTTTLFGLTNAQQVVQNEVNQMLANLGNPEFSIVCSDGGTQQLAPGMQTTTATRLVRAGSFTALIAVNVNASPSLGSSFVGIQMTMAPTAEYDAMVRKHSYPSATNCSLLIAPAFRILITTVFPTNVIGSPLTRTYNNLKTQYVMYL